MRIKVSFLLIKKIEIKKISDFTLTLITIDSEHLGIPDTNYGSIITLHSGEFNRISKELFQLSETVTIETNKNSIKFSVSGDSIGGSIKIDSNDSTQKEETTIIQVEEPINLAFALRYLNMFTKASSLSDQVTLYLSSEYPLMVEYKLQYLGSLRYYLAPRISDDK